MAAATLEVLVRPRSLRLIVPADCAAVGSIEDRPANAFALQLP